MEAVEIRAAKDALVERYGGWRAYNLRLAEDIYTMAPGLIGAAELNIRRVLQLVADHASKPLSELRVLDLGASEGGFTIELASQGARVRSIEGREPHVAKARFAAEALRLTNVDITQGDVRALSPDRDGTFDVVLCLGILYHLPAEDVHDFVMRLASVCEGFALIETNVSLARRVSVQTPAGELHGRLYREDPSHPGDALDATPSFWPTRASLLNLLAAAGFTSVSECLSPPVLVTAELSDHATYLAVKGRPVAPRTIPGIEPSTLRWPEGLRPRAGPTNDRRVALIDRIGSKFNRGLAHRIRRKS